MTKNRNLFCFGLGYSAMALSRRLDAAGWTISGTCRKPSRKAALGVLGISTAIFDGESPMQPAGLLQDITHVLLSIPPSDDGDPAFKQHANDIAATGTVEWLGYFSTTGVYGDRGGDWVDETSELRPNSARSQRRADAERSWIDWGDRHGISVQIFRLPGIYGPGRSAIDQVKAGTARRISKPGHVFSRIHVEDIATTVIASITRPNAGAIYNVCDNEPAAPGDVVSYVCELLGCEPPPEIPYDKADLSIVAKSFWADNRRVRNERIKDELGVRLDFPEYRIGIRGILGLGG
ncbi:MAG: NAD(P)-dependent oxidoreductase [Rhodospirillaceae bacterium]|nr:NAD(P)-dependent oxidoreductase [Rhodospirillaceae bacterium]